jgi:hypothetical protein
MDSCPDTHLKCGTRNINVSKSVELWGKIAGQWEDHLSVGIMGDSGKEVVL